MKKSTLMNFGEVTLGDGGEASESTSTTGTTIPIEAATAVEPRQIDGYETSSSRFATSQNIDGVTVTSEVVTTTTTSSSHEAPPPPSPPPQPPRSSHKPNEQQIEIEIESLRESLRDRLNEIGVESERRRDLCSDNKQQQHPATTLLLNYQNNNAKDTASCHNSEKVQTSSSTTTLFYAKNKQQHVDDDDEQRLSREKLKLDFDLLKESLNKFNENKSTTTNSSLLDSLLLNDASSRQQETSKQKQQQQHRRTSTSLLQTSRAPYHHRRFMDRGESTSTSSQFVTKTPAATTTVFHPTWDEWKRSHHLAENNNNTSNKATTKTTESKSEQSAAASNSGESRHTTTTRSIVEETYRHKHHHHHNNNHNEKSKQQSSEQVETKSVKREEELSKELEEKLSEMKQQISRSLAAGEPKSPSVYQQPAHTVHFDNRSEIVINNGKEATNTKTARSPKHYPVYPFDAQPSRAPEPVHLSSIVLAKEPPLKVETEDSRVVLPAEEPSSREPTPVVELVQYPKKIKTIVTTQKRKESAPNLTGWRSTESDSDTEIQHRLLAKASGSIPIEYISIRRDPKPAERKPVAKKSITTGTNTSCDRGKRIASTNTNTDELPQYNLHVSLDSLFVKGRREASTSTERKETAAPVSNAATETVEVGHKDAFTVTDNDAESDNEPPPVRRQPVYAPPPPPEPEPAPPQPEPQQYVYRSRKSRYTEWETASNPPPVQHHDEFYKLELLAKSPRTMRRKQNAQYQQFSNYFEDEADFSDMEPVRPPRLLYQEVRADDDDRIIFGSSSSSSYQHREERMVNRRSGSFPSLVLRPLVNTYCVAANNNVGSTRRYVKHTQNTSYGGGQVMNQCELGFAPLRVSNGCLNSADCMTQSFSHLNSKFNEIFGQQQQQRQNVCYNTLQHVEAPKTERFYKFSRTVSENKHQQQQQQMPTFGEIYHQRYNSQSSSQQQQQRGFANQQQQYSQHQQVRSPIVEIPVTPDSTLGKMSRQRFFSSSSATSGTAAAANAGYSSSYKATSSGGGPLITPLSPTGSMSNGNWYNSGGSCSSTMQRGFEPVAKQQQQQQSYSTTTRSMTTNNASLDRRAHHGGRRGVEEEEELVSSAHSHGGDPDKQFRPIFHPVLSPELSSSAVSAESSKRQQANYASSSGYEYSADASRQWPNSTYYTTTQTIAN